jgi:hypothetical protein
MAQSVTPHGFGVEVRYAGGYPVIRLTSHWGGERWFTEFNASIEWNLYTWRHEMNSALARILEVADVEGHA